MNTSDNISDTLELLAERYNQLPKGRAEDLDPVIFSTPSLDGFGIISPKPVINLDEIPQTIEDSSSVYIGRGNRWGGSLWTFDCTLEYLLQLSLITDISEELLYSYFKSCMSMSGNKYFVSLGIELILTDLRGDGRKLKKMQRYFRRSIGLA